MRGPYTSAGRECRGPAGVGSPEGGFIDPDRLPTGKPGRVVDKRGAVDGGLCAHCGRPVGMHPAGPFGQYRPRPDLLMALRPRRDRERRLDATPPPLTPHQHHRPAAGGQIPDPDQPAVMQPGQRAAAAATHLARGRLDSSAPVRHRAGKHRAGRNPPSPTLPLPHFCDLTPGASLIRTSTARILRPQNSFQAQALIHVEQQLPRPIAKSLFRSQT